MIVLGSEFKRNIHIDPIDGIHMSEYDFSVAVYAYTNKKVLFKKNQMRKIDDDNYLLIVETEDCLRIGKGKLNFEIIAHIPDSDFSDGFRTEKLLICTDEVII